MPKLGTKVRVAKGRLEEPVLIRQRMTQLNCDAGPHVSIGEIARSVDAACGVLSFKTATEFGGLPGEGTFATRVLEIYFDQPLLDRDWLIVTGVLAKIGKTSLDISLTILAERFGTVVGIGTAYTTMVAISKANGKPLAHGFEPMHREELTPRGIEGTTETLDWRAISGNPIVRVLTFPDNENVNGHLFGGAIATVAQDAAIGCVEQREWSLDKLPDKTNHWTIRVARFDFLRPGKVGEFLSVYGRILDLTRPRSVIVGTVVSQTAPGELIPVTVATGTFVVCRVREVKNNLLGWRWQLRKHGLD